MNTDDLGRKQIAPNPCAMRDRAGFGALARVPVKGRRAAPSAHLTEHEAPIEGGAPNPSDCLRRWYKVVGIRPVRRESWRTEAKGISSKADKIASLESSGPLTDSIGVQPGLGENNPRRGYRSEP